MMANMTTTTTSTMKGTLPSGLAITRTLAIADQKYQMTMTVDVRNTTDHSLQGAPYISMVNHPFIKSADNRWLFTGPSLYSDGKLEQFKFEDLEKGEKTVAYTIGYAKSLWRTVAGARS